jgi:hypothetical protein
MTFTHLMGTLQFDTGTYYPHSRENAKHGGGPKLGAHDSYDALIFRNIACATVRALGVERCTECSLRVCLLDKRQGPETHMKRVKC